VLYPTNTYSLRYNVLLYGLALLTSAEDSVLDFGRHVKVSVRGLDDEVELLDERGDPLPVEEVEFDEDGEPVIESDLVVFSDGDVAELTDPESHYTYRAAKIMDRHGHQQSIAYSLVWKARQQHFVHVMPALRALDDIDPAADPDEWDAAVREYEEQRRDLEETIELMDVIRQFLRTYGI